MNIETTNSIAMVAPRPGDPSPPSAPPKPDDPQAPSASLVAWWRVVDFRIGIIPGPVVLLLAGLIWAFTATGKVPSDILMNIAMLGLGGFACAELGKRIPGINQIGAAAIFATFIPSYLVYAHLIPEPVKASITEFTKASNFLYLFIAAIIVGSIFGMDRKVLVSGFLKIFVPLAAGSLVAALVGVGVGTALGLDPRHTLFFVVMPIMAGGVGEGAIPLSIGYAHLSHGVQGDLLAEILPSVMFGSLTAILFSGVLNMVGKRLPHLTGEGRLSIGEKDDLPLAGDEEDAPRAHPGAATVAAAAVTAVSLYLVGALAQKLFDFPGPVTMLFLAVVLKLGRLVSPDLERGAFAVFQFFRTAVTYPLLFAIGVAMTPWDKLMTAFSLANVVTIVATVTALMGTGFLVARLVRMYPIDVAIVAACHSGQGGTGDVAILTAANRMQLMPFAQIATRIGGALTVTLGLVAFAKMTAG